MPIRKTKLKALFGAAFASALLVATQGAHAAPPCAGFTDTDALSGFCIAGDIEWIKNRGVTVGCQLPGQPLRYCPTDPVTREQMAAFMHRLGNVLSPAVLAFEQGPGPIDLDLVPNPKVCITPDIDGAAPPPPALPGKPYPRRAFIHTTFAGQAAGALQYRTDLQVSTDGGASWDFIWENFANFDGTAGAHWVSSSHSGSVDLQPNLPYRFAIIVRRQGAVTADFTDSRCFVTVSIFSRSGASSPFDVGGATLELAPAKPLNADH